MSEESLETEIKNPNKIPVRERAAFQRFLLQLMFSEKPINKTKEEWSVEKANWLEAYGGKIISDIIDDPKNKEIRDFIMQGEYQEASKLVIKILRASESEIAA